jgi:predicted porin
MMSCRTTLSLTLFAVAALPFSTFGQAPAAAPELKVYGTVNVDVELVNRDGATAPGGAGNSVVRAPTVANQPSFSTRRRITSNSSNFGVRGAIDLVPGLRAVAQIESSVSMDGGGGTIAGRNTYAGLAGDFGTLLYVGAHDTPYKRGGKIQEKDPFFATTFAALYGVRGSPGFNQVAGAAPAAGTASIGGDGQASFAARVNNAIWYATPKWMGLSGEVAVSADEARTASGAAVRLDPWLVSGSLTYEIGTAWASFAYERRSDIFALSQLAVVGGAAGNTAANSTGSTDQAYVVGVGYTLLKDTDFLLVLERLSFQSDAGAGAPAAFVTKYDRDAIMAAVSHRLGPHRVAGAVSLAGKADCSSLGGNCDASGTDAQQYTLGYHYSLSARATAYLYGTWIRNGRLASYTWGVAPALGGSGSGTAPLQGFGADPKAIGLGVRYAF